MNQDEVNTRAASDKPPVSKWAAASWRFAACGWLSVFFTMVVTSILSLLTRIFNWELSENVDFIANLAVIGIVLFAGVTSVAAVVTGIVALVAIRMKRMAVRGLGRAVASVSIALLFLVLAVLIELFVCVVPREAQEQSRCTRHIEILGEKLREAAERNGGYFPTKSEWCDALVRRGKIPKYAWLCPGSISAGDKGPCHYALNPDCEPNSPRSVVLLFETKGGWNQSGGPELLTYDNHLGRGANVLFNDGHVEFVRPEDAGKLKWKVEEANKVKSRGVNNELKN